MAKFDKLTSLRTIESFQYLKGVKGVYILLNLLTGFVKIGRTYSFHKRYKDLSPITSPHLVVAFFPTEKYAEIEKEFHRKHRSSQVDQEYFMLTPAYAYQWMEDKGQKTVFFPSFSEIFCQRARIEWVKIVKEVKCTFTDYFNSIFTKNRCKTGVQCRFRMN